VLAILPRRAGKDITALNYVIRQMWEFPGVYYYIFPTYSQAKKVIWDSITNDGKKILDFFPNELVLQKNGQEMKIRMRSKNGKDSLFQLIGSDNYDSLMGTNPRGCVFSEYALQDTMAYKYIRPILTANGGWALFISTPRGKNHLWEIAQLAQNSPDWFYYKLTVDETQHIPFEEIEKEKREGLMSEDLIQQEFYTSFEMGVEGSYYAKYIDKMKRENKIGDVPWENGFKVHTAWDIGVRDHTCIIFFQTIGQTIRIIDCYENSKHGIEHYAEILENKPYIYGTHIAPHDIRVKEWGSGITRFEKARQLGIKFTVADNLEIPDGIEAVRSLFSKLWIDEVKCKALLIALENYRQEYDHKKKVYKPRPLHDFASHFCFVGETQISTSDGLKFIKDIQIGDKVLTPKGEKKVLNKFLKKSNKILKISTQDSFVYCTPDHKIFSDKGLISADALRYNDHLISFGDDQWKQLNFTQETIGFKKNFLSVKMNNPLFLRDMFINGKENIIEEEHQKITRILRFKELYGQKDLDKFLPNIIFTIKMGTQKIIQSKIWNLFQRPNMLKDTCQQKKEKKCHWRVLNQPLRKLKNGILLQKVLNGIKNMRETLSLDIAEFRRSAFCVMTPMYLVPSIKNFVPPDASKNKDTDLEKIEKNEDVKFAFPSSSVINTLKKQLVQNSVQQLYANELEVFDLEIEDDHCYYANGLLVSNCDAARYLAISLPKTRDGLTSEELNKRYEEAMWGHQANIPAPFRQPTNYY